MEPIYLVLKSEKRTILKTVSPSRGQDPLKPQSAEAPEARIRKRSIFGQQVKKGTFVRTKASGRQSCMRTDKAYIETYSQMTSPLGSPIPSRVMYLEKCGEMLVIRQSLTEPNKQILYTFDGDGRVNGREQVLTHL